MTRISAVTVSALPSPSTSVGSREITNKGLPICNAVRTKVLFFSSAIPFVTHKRPGHYVQTEVGP